MKKTDPTEHDHTYTPSEKYITLTVVQDAMEAPCEHCGKRTQGQYATPQAWAHELDCPEYRPHPSSVAGIAAQTKGA